jgi:hypothetical protein
VQDGAHHVEAGHTGTVLAQHNEADVAAQLGCVEHCHHNEVGQEKGGQEDAPMDTHFYCVQQPYVIPYVIPRYGSI